jgi:hypothetical protein
MMSILRCNATYVYTLTQVIWLKALAVFDPAINKKAPQQPGSMHPKLG